ncbi:polyketide synthase, partial [Streptomyces sp. NPDC006265]
MSELNEPQEDTGSDIAVVGMACRFPGAPDVETFWANLRDGVESIRHFTPEELAELGVPPEVSGQPGFVPAGAPIDDPEGFDHRFWGYSPREAALLDPQQRLFLETAWAALEHAGHTTSDRSGTVGVYAGMGLSTYLLYNLLDHPDISDSDTQLAMLGNDKDFLSSRVSYHLDLRGPSMTVQTGCSTSLVAAHLACDSLLSYQCDLALVGGSTVVLPERTGYVHVPGGTASSDGRCRAFDAAGDGTVFGSGAGVLALKRLDDALEDGDTVYAVIKASAVNSDGANRVGFTAPSLDGQAEVVLRAQKIADVDPRTVTYVETHGTATK